MASRSLSPKQIAERERDHHFAVISLARYKAKKAAEAKLRDQGIRLTTYPPAQLRALTEAELKLNLIALMESDRNVALLCPLSAQSAADIGHA